jgi:hypothetical protein
MNENEFFGQVSQQVELKSLKEDILTDLMGQ